MTITNVKIIRHISDGFVIFKGLIHFSIFCCSYNIGGISCIGGIGGWNASSEHDKFTAHDQSECRIDATASAIQCVATAATAAANATAKSQQSTNSGIK